MGVSASTESHVAAILNAAWMVRHHARGLRLESQAAKRAAAINQLGLVVREAFQKSEEFEVLLTAVVDGLSPRPPEF